MTHVMGRKLLIVRDYLEHEVVINSCAPVPHTDVHGDFLMMPVIQVFAAAGLPLKYCPVPSVFSSVV